jgi:hypothetical protein
MKYLWIDPTCQDERIQQRPARRRAAAKIRLCNADDGHTLTLEVGQNGIVHHQIAGQTSSFSMMSRSSGLFNCLQQLQHCRTDSPAAARLSRDLRGLHWLRHDGELFRSAADARSRILAFHRIHCTANQRQASSSPFIRLASSSAPPLPGLQRNLHNWLPLIKRIWIGCSARRGPCWPPGAERKVMTWGRATGLSTATIRILTGRTTP